MKKIFLTICLSLLIGFNVNATCDETEGFDSYADDSDLIGQGNWTGNVNSGSVYIQDDGYERSAPNSLAFEDENMSAAQYYYYNLDMPFNYMEWWVVSGAPDTINIMFLSEEEDTIFYLRESVLYSGQYYFTLYDADGTVLDRQLEVGGGAGVYVVKKVYIDSNYDVKICAHSNCGTYKDLDLELKMPFNVKWARNANPDTFANAMRDDYCWTLDYASDPIFEIYSPTATGDYNSGENILFSGIYFAPEAWLDSLLFLEVYNTEEDYYLFDAISTESPGAWAKYRKLDAGNYDFNVYIIKDENTSGMVSVNFDVSTSTTDHYSFIDSTTFYNNNIPAIFATTTQSFLYSGIAKIVDLTFGRVAEQATKVSTYLDEYDFDDEMQEFEDNYDTVMAYVKSLDALVSFPFFSILLVIILFSGILFIIKGIFLIIRLAKGG